jgi:hypothetical protein
VSPSTLNLGDKLFDPKNRLFRLDLASHLIFFFCGLSLDFLSAEPLNLAVFWSPVPPLELNVARVQYSILTVTIMANYLSAAQAHKKVIYEIYFKILKATGPSLNEWQWKLRRRMCVEKQSERIEKDRNLREPQFHASQS